jgi:ankyrin repeat protein
MNTNVGGRTMKVIHYAVLLTVTITCLLLLSVDTAHAQEFPHTYLFVEVKDNSGNALADASINAIREEMPLRKGGKQELISGLKTDKNGIASGLLYYGGNPPMLLSLQVSKPGYLPYEDIFSSESNRPLLGIENPAIHADWRLKVVLLRTPVTSSERHAVELEQRQRQLLLAAKKGDAVGAHRLLQAGASVNTADAQGVPPILWAAFMGEVETIKVLLAAGADVRGKNNPGHETLMVYLDRGLMYCRFRAHEKFMADEKHERGPDLCDEVIVKLIDAGAGVNSRNPQLKPTAYVLIGLPHYISARTFKALIEAGVNPNVLDENGSTPLMHAVSTSVTVNRLLAAGVPINATDKRGQTALIYAARDSHYGHAALQILIRAGAAINIADQDGRTALMTAAAARGPCAVENIRLLLAAGAKFDLVDRKGQTALMIAKETEKGGYAPPCETAIKLLEEAQSRH